MGIRSHHDQMSMSTGAHTHTPPYLHRVFHEIGDRARLLCKCQVSSVNEIGGMGNRSIEYHAGSLGNCTKVMRAFQDVGWQKPLLRKDSRVRWMEIAKSKSTGSSWSKKDYNATTLLIHTWSVNKRGMVSCGCWNFTMHFYTVDHTKEMEGKTTAFCSCSSNTRACLRYLWCVLVLFKDGQL